MQQAIEDLPVILENLNGVIQQQTEFITLSPQHEHTNVLEHMANRMGV